MRNIFNYRFLLSPREDTSIESHNSNNSFGSTYCKALFYTFHYYAIWLLDHLSHEQRNTLNRIYYF